MTTFRSDMKYLSVCSGIEAVTVAWKPLGWQPVAFSEIEKFPSQVLAHHYPDVPNLGDMTKFQEWKHESIDIFVGGTPCQSFSVAGLRKGLADPRGNLMLTYLAIAERYRPQWMVWENVTGVLSSNEGRDFGTFLAALAECGYGFAYRVLDAQYFGVAQRRRRVFVVGYHGDWRPAAAVLFERESLSGHPAPSREKGKNIAKCLTRGAMQRFDSETDTMIPVYGIQGNWIGRAPENGGNATEPMNQIAPCLTKTDRHGVAQPTAVRRLTPVECERLQGFQDGYTDIKQNDKDTPDGPRYKALGNSMAVPVMRWIGQRIQMVEDLCKK